MNPNKHINNHINKYNMNVDKSTNVVGDEEIAREFNESVNHLYQPLDEWVKEDASNRSYVLVISRKEGEGKDESLKSVFNACGNKYIMKQSISKAMETSDGVKKLIIGSQKMFVANTINRIMSEEDDEPEGDDETEKGGER